ncbi:MAG: hypothetical protein QG639_323 [Patescibacteria group bacterium]|nr:hypothetical protein [Patescibacteria group bacterium]
MGTNIPIFVFCSGRPEGEVHDHAIQLVRAETVEAAKRLIPMPEHGGEAEDSLLFSHIQRCSDLDEAYSFARYRGGPQGRIEAYGFDDNKKVRCDFVRYLNLVFN